MYEQVINDDEDDLEYIKDITSTLKEDFTGSLIEFNIDLPEEYIFNLFNNDYISEKSTINKDNTSKEQTINE